MPFVRCLMSHRALAAAFCTLALLVRLVVPAGYMVASDHGRPTIILCPAASGVAPAMAAMPAMHGGMAHPAHDHAKADADCPFGSLVAAATDTAAAPLPVGTVAFGVAMADGVAAVAARSAVAHLRPPLRGPPVA